MTNAAPAALPTDGRPTWDKLDAEPVEWFKRFELFRDDDNRSLLKAYNAWRSLAGKGGIKKRTPNSWNLASQKYRWRERGDAFDLYQIDKKRREREQERQTARATRIAVLESYLGKLIAGISALDPAKQPPGWRDLTNGLRSVVPELRAEYGETALDDGLAGGDSVASGVRRFDVVVVEKTRCDRNDLDKLTGSEP